MFSQCSRRAQLHMFAASWRPDARRGGAWLSSSKRKNFPHGDVRLDVFTSDRRISALPRRSSCLQSERIDGSRHQYALMSAEINRKFRFTMRKVFLLRQLQACHLATPGAMVMLAWVAGHDTDGCRTEYALMPAESCQKFRCVP